MIGDTPAPAYCDDSMAHFTPVAAAAWAGALPAIPQAQGGPEPTTILTRGFVVKVIARIPALDSVVAVAPLAIEATTAAEAPSAASANAPGSVLASAPARPRRRHSGSRFPFGSVAVLAILAAFAWSLASWNECRRIERARAERIARVQGFQATPGTTAR